jgi:hypothetical protein
MLAVRQHGHKLALFHWIATLRWAIKELKHHVRGNVGRDNSVGAVDGTLSRSAGVMAAVPGVQSVEDS